uniref:OBP16 n=1 Tax=Holotrichia parallela TaxID=93412 RepID=A0A0G2YIU0_HOLPA|nr:OBP16 [Holotrichia parallela]
MNKILVVSTVLLGIASAYDFSDAYFNQLLTKEFDDLTLSESSIAHPRARRDDEAAKCHHKHKFCCAEDLLFELYDKIRDMKKECLKEVTGKEFHGGPPFTCEELEQRKKEMICVAECMGKKKGVLDADGNIKEEELKKSVKESMSGLDWFQPLMDDVITKCIAEAKEAADKREAGGCNPSDLKLVHCFFKEIQLSCPADQIKDQARCDALRESVKKHDFPPPH